MIRTLTALLLVLGISAPAYAETFNAEEVEEINSAIENYLMEHPEKLIESLNKYQEKQMKEQQEAAKKQIKSSRKQLNNDKTSPIIGNKSGDFVIVEFFDYNCGYCKMMFPKLLDFVGKDGAVKWVLKELPTLSEESTTAAKIALAANKQGKYREVHTAFMNAKGRLDKAALLELAKAQGVDIAVLQKDMESPEIQAILDKNRELAGKIGVNGIPAFVINDEMKGGAFDTEELKATAAEVRAAKAERIAKRNAARNAKKKPSQAK